MRVVGVTMVIETAVPGCCPPGTVQRMERGPRKVGTAGQRPKSTRSTPDAHGRSPRMTTRVHPAAGPCDGTTRSTASVLLLVLLLPVLVLVLEGTGTGTGTGEGTEARARTWELWETTRMGLAATVWTTV